MLFIRKQFFCQIECWQEAAAIFHILHEKGYVEDWLAYATCLTKAARYGEAYVLLKQHEESGNIQYWRLRGWLAEYLCDASDMKVCWKNVAKLAPSLFEEATERLSRAEILQHFH